MAIVDPAGVLATCKPEHFLWNYNKYCCLPFPGLASCVLKNISFTLEEILSPVSHVMSLFEGKCRKRTEAVSIKNRDPQCHLGGNPNLL